jgi:predicted RNA binding protein YcfA (HicA-like mRNA interferase family)
MARMEKLLLRTRNNQRDVRFSDLLMLVEAFGYVPIRQRPGSHRRYVHPATGEYLNLQPDVHGKAKPYQVAQFLEQVDRRTMRQESDQ